MRGREVFFEQELEGVGDRLKQARRADAIRADAILNQCTDPALRIDAVVHEAEDDREQAGDLRETDSDEREIHQFAAFSDSGLLPSCLAGSSGFAGAAISITCTPRSPVLLKLNPFSSRTD